jgi:hypothetical protein
MAEHRRNQEEFDSDLKKGVKSEIVALKVLFIIIIGEFSYV